jgi:hypothetical protein
MQLALPRRLTPNGLATAARLGALDAFAPTTTTAAILSVTPLGKRRGCRQRDDRHQYGRSRKEGCHWSASARTTGKAVATTPVRISWVFALIAQAVRRLHVLEIDQSSYWEAIGYSHSERASMRAASLSCILGQGRQSIGTVSSR